MRYIFNNMLKKTSACMVRVNPLAAKRAATAEVTTEKKVEPVAEEAAPVVEPAPAVEQVSTADKLDSISVDQQTTATKKTTRKRKASSK